MGREYGHFYRTDMADEISDDIYSSSGIKIYKSTIDNTDIIRTEIVSDIGKDCTNNQKDIYVCIETKDISDISKKRFCNITDIISSEISTLIPESGSCLVAGLGNRNIAADAIGPNTTKHIVVTRHIMKQSRNLIEDSGMREVFCISPDVTGNTGMEAAEIIKGIAKETGAGFVIVIDALVSRKLSRLGKSVQITNAGISPGSGVMNNRCSVTKEHIGTDVIAIGVPTVVDAATLTVDVLESNGIELSENDKRNIMKENNMFFTTTKETDHIINDMAKIIGYSINKALHKDITCDEMDEMLN